MQADLISAMQKDAKELARRAYQDAARQDLIDAGFKTTVWRDYMVKYDKVKDTLIRVFIRAEKVDLIVSIGGRGFRNLSSKFPARAVERAEQWLKDCTV